ncbi:MAG: hypothetical protein ACLFN8_00225 [Candidatus Woesearchaeota archaeon]
MNTQLEKTYDYCIIHGKITENTEDTENTTVQTTIEHDITETQKILEEIKTQKTKTPEQKLTQFNKYYDALTILKNIIIQKNNTQIEEEQCKNAYICIKYPTLELNFEFLESMRLRKDTQKEIKNEEWTMIKINFELHIKSCMNYLK